MLLNKINETLSANEIFTDNKKVYCIQIYSLKDILNKAECAIDENDLLDIALSLPDGSQYKEIESNVTSVLDHSMNDDGSVLTVLVQVDNTLFMKKYQIKTMQKISEKEINKIIKNR